jgi:hypothetical protein
MQLIPTGVDGIFHAVGDVALVVVIAYVRKINRLVSLFGDFPPHRHDNGHILYPKGYEPTKVGRISGDGK